MHEIALYDGEGKRLRVRGMINNPVNGYDMPKASAIVDQLEMNLRFLERHGFSIANHNPQALAASRQTLEQQLGEDKRAAIAALDIPYEDLVHVNAFVHMLMQPPTHPPRGVEE
jgi:hypothetical protein